MKVLGWALIVTPLALLVGFALVAMWHQLGWRMALGIWAFAGVVTGMIAVGAFLVGS